jgi:hypothetical protein
MEAMKTLKEQVETILSRAYRGLHNVPGKLKILGLDLIEISVPTCTLATFDNDSLTRLVVMAHDECVRMCMRNSGPGQIYLRFTPRIREGNFCERHDTIEQAIQNIRK